MATNTIDYGIDLGTTTSSIAKVNGKDTEIIPNLKDGSMNFTYSAVSIENKKGKEKIFVGRKAKINVLLYPEDAYAAFKRRMGDNVPYHFKQANKDLLPEALSAEILRSLKNDVLHHKGDSISSIVITVPADFNQTKIEATKRAANLAGFEEKFLIKEPEAAALAYVNESSDEDDGYWMVYDLGGGTFDVAIVRKIGNDFDFITNVGDEHLGGELIDLDIVDDVFVPEIINELGLNDFSRINESKYLEQFAKLKVAAEEAKIELSNYDESDVFLPEFIKDDEGEGLDFEYDLTVEELKNIMAPYIARTIDSCYEALAKASLEASDIKKIILVGGSTYSPIIRNSLKEEFNIDLDYSIDPITVVARGAAIYAGTKTKTIDPDMKKSSNDYFVELEYEPRGTEETIFVAYTVTPPEGDSLDDCYIEFINTKSGESSGRLKVDGGPSFTNLKAEDEEVENIFKVQLTNSHEVLTIDENSHDTIKYIMAPEIPQNKLLHTYCLGLADNSPFIFAEEGQKLPFEDRKIFQTTVTVKKDHEGFIRIPLYEGAREKADRNPLISELLITAEDIDRDLPKGSEIQIDVSIDEEQTIEVTAFIVSQKLIIDEVVTIGNIILPDVSELENKFRLEMERYDELKHKYSKLPKNETVDKYFESILNHDMVNQINKLIGHGRNQLEAANDRLNEFGYYLDLIEDIINDELNFIKKVNSLESLFKKVENLVQDGDLLNEVKLLEYRKNFNDTIKSHDVDSLDSIRKNLNKIEWELDAVNKSIKNFTNYKKWGVFIANKEISENLIKRGDNIVSKMNDSEKPDDYVGQLNDINSQLREIDERIHSNKPESYDVEGGLEKK